MNNAPFLNRTVRFAVMIAERSEFLTFLSVGDIIHLNGNPFRKTSYFTDNKCHLLLSDGKVDIYFFEKESVYHDEF